jgi:uncharacterized protein (DUF1697 family)
MADLRRVTEACGFPEPRTYIQSGNLIFNSPRKNVAKVAAELRAALKQDLGLDIAMIIRTRAQLEAVVDANPFIAEGLDPNQQSVSFFAEDIPADLFAGVALEQYAPEAVRLSKREVYFNLPLGTGHSPMLKDIGRRKGLNVATMRNWRTVTTLLSIAAETSPTSH